MSKTKEIAVPEWWHRGTIFIRRDALHPDHKESKYNYIKNVLGETPECFGVYKSGNQKCPSCGIDMEAYNKALLLLSTLIDREPGLNNAMFEEIGYKGGDDND